jgi:unsaturated chondroitin disaccharide hydrolase
MKGLQRLKKSEILNSTSKGETIFMNENTLLKSLRQSAEFAYEFAQKQVRNLIKKHPDYFPLYTRDGRWSHSGQAWTSWCEGFLAGMMWIFARRTGDPWWRRKAEHYSKLIEHRKSERTTQSLGSLFMTTWKRWYDMTGDKKCNDVVIEAGRTLSLRYNNKGRYLESFVAPESNLIDNMMSVIVIFYAASQTNDDKLLRIATEHCLTARRFLVRGDGSTAHEGIFDPGTGEFLRHSTHQGWRIDSSWARGQAWAIYGFGNAYKFTGDERFLDTAQRCADFYMERTAEHGIPPNDWDEPNAPYPCESSAAAAAASGMLRLSRLTEDRVRSDRNRKYAHIILSTLCTPEFLANETPGWEGILKHGIYHQRKGLGVDESVMWGDHYFVEGLDAILE